MTRVPQIFACSSLFIFTISYYAFSEVIVNDMIVPRGEKAMLVAETKGKFFSKGGEVVEFFIDGKSIGRTLSGGDGLAFKSFIPVKAGTYHIIAKSGKDEGDGLLLSLKQGTELVFVDIEGSLMERPFSKKPRNGSQIAIKEINRRFPVVFLHNGFVSIKMIKAWLKENKFKQLPVIPWKQGSAFDDIEGNGFRLKAIIGSPQVIESAGKYHPTAYSFEEAGDAIEVKDWEEIRKRLERN